MIRKLAHTALSKGTVAIINFFILLISSRYLGPVSRGEIGIFLLNIAIMQVLAEVYTGYSIIHFMHGARFRRLLRDGLLVILIVSTCGTFFVQLMQRDVTGNFISHLMATVLVLVHTFFMVLLLGLKRLRVYNILAVLQPLLLAGFLVVLIFAGHNYTFNSYYLALLLSFLATACCSGFFLWRTGVPAGSRYELKTLLSRGAQFQASLLMFMFINRYNYYLLSDNKAVGLYNVGSTLVEAALLPSYATGAILLSQSSEKDNNGFSLARICMVTGLFATIATWLVPDDLMTFLLGPSYAGITGIMRVYALTLVPQSILIVLSNYFAGAGHQSLVLRAYLPAFVIVLVSAPVMVSNGGTFGAALAAILGFVCSAALMLKQLYRLDKNRFRSLFEFR